MKEEIIDYEKLGSRIREERLKMHLTQAKLAEDIGISDTYMGAIERGERSVRINTLAKIAVRLGFSFDFIFENQVKNNDENIINEFKQIIDGKSIKQKQMAIDVLRTIFSYI